MRRTTTHPIVAVIIHDATVFGVISLSAIATFLHGFPSIRMENELLLRSTDVACMLFFVVEAILKIHELQFSNYWRSSWNKLDFVIVLTGTPLLLTPLLGLPENALSLVLLLRLLRCLRFFRFMRFIPNASHIGRGIARSMRASVGVFLALLMLLLIFSLSANILFGEVIPEFFGDPIVSLYSIFQVFTIEGWNEIPNAVAQTELSRGWVTLLRAFFVCTVLVGGLLGLSLANAVFVDEMTSDNTERLESLVCEIRVELQEFRSEMQTVHGGSRGDPSDGESGTSG